MKLRTSMSETFVVKKHYTFLQRFPKNLCLKICRTGSFGTNIVTRVLLVHISISSLPTISSIKFLNGTYILKKFLTTNVSDITLNKKQKLTVSKVTYW